MPRRLFSISGLILAILLFFAVNVFSNAAFRHARLDLTENRLYTLSEGAQNILNASEEPISLRFYVSKKLAPLLPGIHSYVLRVGELLEEFEQVAGGKLALEVIDLEPFSEEEDRAVAYGMKGVPISNSDRLFYFGLVGTSATDDEQVVAFFQPEREQFLEYDIAKLVYQLAHPKRKVIGLMSWLPLDGTQASPVAQAGGQSQSWMIYEQMRQSFEVRTVSTDATAVPEDVDVLMIVHPNNLSEATRYAIDQFVLRGGRSLVFVDPHSEAAQAGMSPFNPMAARPQTGSNLPELFAAWGVELVGGKVAGDLPFARRVQYRRQLRILATDYPVWIDLPPSQFNQEELVTAQLPNLTFATAGILKQQDESTTEFIPLVETDESAMKIEVGRVQLVRDIASLVQTYRAGGEKLTLAVRLTGKVESAFPDGAPPGFDETDQGNHLTESVDPVNVIVVADTDLLQDYFWVQFQSFLGQRLAIPTSGNGSLVINALENLTGSNDLISVRSRGSFQRPFTLVRAIQQDAERRFLLKEQELVDRKRSTERKIQELQVKKQDSSVLVLSPEQEREIERFRQELLQIRKDLRGVRHELQKNIEGLETWVKFINIGVMPLLIGIGGLLVSVRTARRPQSSSHVQRGE